MELKKGQTIDVEISDVAFGGNGIAKVDGLVIFVERAITGDRVTARIIKKKKNHAIARIDTILQPSSHRIPAPCQYSGYCGGCKWQFLAYEKQIEYKRQHVVDSVSHIGGMDDIPIHPTVPSREIFGYRNKMEFSCSETAWLLPDAFAENNGPKDFAIGLHVPGTYHKVIDIEACLIQPPLGNDILNDIRAFIRDSGLPIYGLRSHVGFWRFVMLRHSVAYDQWMVNIVTAAENPQLLGTLADALINRYPQITSVVNNVTAKKSSVAVGEVEIALAGASVLREQIGEHLFDIHANSFFQTNTRGAQQLFNIVKAYADLSGKERVVDLYSGTGTIAIHLSDQAKEIVGIEINKDSVADARNNCRINHITNCRFLEGDINECFSQLDGRPAVMVIDPPRAGMHKKVVKQVLDMAPDRIVYVSCNPATLARDLGLLKESYGVKEIQPVDMFPHTYHIEAVARLEKKHNRGGC